MNIRTGHDRRGEGREEIREERRGQHMSGQDKIGVEWTAHEWTGLDKIRVELSGVDTGQIRVEWTGQHMRGQDKIRVDRTGDSKYLKSHHFTTQDGSGIGAVRL